MGAKSLSIFSLGGWCSELWFGTHFCRFEPPLDETIIDTKLVEKGVFRNHVILKVVKLSEKKPKKCFGIWLKADLEQKLGIENWKMKYCDQL